MYSRRKFISFAIFLFHTAFFFIIGKRKVRAEAPEVVLSNLKYVTPSMPRDNYVRPRYFANTNNLRRKAGSPFLAKGEFLSIEGYITDIVDVPIEDVMISIWQTNHMGYYNHIVDTQDESLYDPDFLSNGICRTDNSGYYSFVTIMPGYYGHRAPHVHFLIQHDSFKKLETEMFFPNHPRNVSDNFYKELSQQKKTLVTCRLVQFDDNDDKIGKKALFNIKLDGFHPYKRY